MGAIRKTFSVLTFGLIDFRSDKERTARYTKKSSKEAAKQTELMQQMMRERDQGGAGPGQTS